MRSLHSLPAPRRSVYFFAWLLLFITGSGYSQSIISGTITGSDGGVLSGATVVIKGTNKFSITDAAGHFNLSANPGELIECSFLGYDPYQITLGNETELNISLQLSSMMLNEVVVMGYGTSLRKDVTGSVASIAENEFIKGNITNPLQQIQGKVAGVVIVQPGGDPNGDFTVRIRGATSLEGQPPLLVIDGVAIDDFNRAITTLNPADIESYDILKDAAAAAIYGARGANGVILVTSKKGRAGRTLVEYNGFVSMEKISNQLNVLSADQWRDAMDVFVDSLTRKYLDKGANTDWQKEISQTAFSQSHSVSLSGGKDQLSFRGSLGYIKQDGVIINTGKEVITTRLSVVQKNFHDKLEINYGINTSVINRDFLPDQSSTSQVFGGGSFIFAQTLGYLPVFPAYDSLGSLYEVPFFLNPLYFLKEVYSKKRENFFQSSVKADYEVITGLKAGVRGALSRGNDVYDNFFPGIAMFSVLPSASKSNSNRQVFSGDIHLNYHKDFGRHSFDVIGVYEYNKFVNDGFSVNAIGFLVPELLNNNLGAATIVNPSGLSSFKNEVRLISFLGRVVYNYDDRFIFTANFRRDGSSKFGPNQRWGNFPSLAMAWRINNEKILKDFNWLNNLKLRMSYGFTGNQENLAPYSHQLLYGPTGPYLYSGQFQQSYGVVQENNPDLKWEVRRSLNVGLDFSIFDNRINGIVDVFDDQTSDMLYQYDLPVPPFLTPQVSANAADAVNRGVEVTIGVSILKNSAFEWDLRTNIGTLKNYVTNLSGQFKGADLSITNRHYGYADGRGLSNAYISELAVGHPAGVFWLPQHAGLDAKGRELFNKYDDNGKFVGTDTSYTDNDRIYIDPTPSFTWGVTNTFTYKNFDLSFFFRGVQGQKIFANSLLTQEATVYLAQSVNVTEKALTNGFTRQPVPSTYWLRDGSYARLENVTLGYNFKNLKGMSRLRLYLVARNLFVINSYDGIDPEIKTEGTQRYIDQNYYPKSRGFTFGVDVGF